MEVPLTDEAIFDDYLRAKNLGDDTTRVDQFFNTVTISDFEPCDLPRESKFKLKEREREWWFFSPTSRYIGGDKGVRSTKSGSWRDTQQPIFIYRKSGDRPMIGVMYVLMYFIGTQTNFDWVIHEYQICSSPLSRQKTLKYSLCKLMFNGRESEFPSPSPPADNNKAEGGVETFLFTSESVNEGQPDKLCDQISDAVLDACLEQDPESKVACETFSKTNMVMVFGEITTKATVDYEKIVRDTCRAIGFVSDDVGLDADNCKVQLEIEQKSPDIAQGVHGHFTKRPEDIAAGDQGQVFGYATDETPELMPLSHGLATKLGLRLTEVRENGTCAWLRPDGKTQVTVEYYNDKGAMVPIRVRTVLITTQHDETVTNDEIARELKEHVIKPVIPEKYIDEKTIVDVNPSGRFVIGGPHGDAGFTGRKIINDTYGGWGAHGGVGFSGKDPTKVDRSGAYIARQAAKSVVANGMARRALVQVSYAIGVPEPLSVFVDTYGTGLIPDKEILKIVKESFDFRPGMVTIDLDLKSGGKGRFLKTAAYGHFGRNDPDFTWEVVKPLKWDKTLRKMKREREF